jgi:putative transposase
MSLDPDLHHRKSTRLRARDYSSPGHYFVTLCTQDRRLLFGDVIDGIMRLNDMGLMAESCWREIPGHFPHAALDEFVIMPNHVHGIIRIVDFARSDTQMPMRAIGIPIVPGLVMAGANVLEIGKNGIVGANNYSPLHNRILKRTSEITRWNPRGTSRTIGSMIRGFKIGVMRWANVNGHIGPVWQRNYHDHIIRNDRSRDRIRRYIRDNPAHWTRDRQNPDRGA